MADFTNNPGVQSAILTTGTLDEVGTLGVVADRGAASEILIYIKNTSANALTEFKAQCRVNSRAGWVDYLAGSDWVSTSNGAQRNWSSGAVATLASGAQVAAQIKTLGIPLWRFVASGTAGSVIEVEFKDVTPQF